MRHQSSRGCSVRVATRLRGKRAAAAVAVIAAVGLATGCGDVNSALERLSQARRLAADLQIQFTKAADAANRAVMADTDEVSIAFARESREATAAVQKNIDGLAPLLQGLGYLDEVKILDEFRARFAEYQNLDRTILDLAVENTNLKAQRLSFGAAQQAADAFRDALEAVAPAADQEAWHVKALVATAVANVRDIQAIQAPHIADPDDAAMARMEKRMAAAEADARGALKTLAPLVQPASRPKLSGASAALDQFVHVNAEIVTFSRRNTNVRSLALSLNEKGKLIAACESRLQALRDALAKRAFRGTR